MTSSGTSSGANISGANDAGLRYPLDPNAEPDASEFSWGAGIEPSSVRGKPYAEGGRYRGTTPDCDPIIGMNRR
ncbi:hypothetical protein [Mycolicibacterium stellerae]|uniref:hypothetical protein n=1 Tax=Mycolicibacterium stellerae TaxID=2358193 RepID=UPI000F0BBC95|nr:hypothetical protein [Mycolicibacterium stellerae]